MEEESERGFYYYKVKYVDIHGVNRIDSYSGAFETKEKAKEWREGNGQWLVDKFGRDLVLRGKECGED